jgi:hypothetical protein
VAARKFTLPLAGLIENMPPAAEDTEALNATEEALLPVVI